MSHFRVEGCYCHLLGEGQRCSQTSYNAHDRPSIRKNYLPQKSNAEIEINTCVYIKSLVIDDTSHMDVSFIQGLLYARYGVKTFTYNFSVVSSLQVEMIENAKSAARGDRRLKGRIKIFDENPYSSKALPKNLLSPKAVIVIDSLL